MPSEIVNCKENFYSVWRDLLTKYTEKIGNNDGEKRV